MYIVPQQNVTMILNFSEQVWGEAHTININFFLVIYIMQKNSIYLRWCWFECSFYLVSIGLIGQIVREFWFGRYILINGCGVPYYRVCDFGSVNGDSVVVVVVVGHIFI